MPHHFTDITGKRFGRLLALWPVGRDKSRNHLWLFQCDCRRFAVSRSANVVHSGVISCGCQQGRRGKFAAAISAAKRFRDLSGRRIGWLTVLEYLGKRFHPGGDASHLYLCLCRCGKVCTRLSRTLKRKNGIPSCGCRRRLLRSQTARRMQRLGVDSRMARKAAAACRVLFPLGDATGVDKSGPDKTRRDVTPNSNQRKDGL